MVSPAFREISVKVGKVAVVRAIAGFGVCMTRKVTYSAEATRVKNSSHRVHREFSLVRIRIVQDVLKQYHGQLVLDFDRSQCVLVSFARPGRSKAQPFPQNRESSLPSARFQRLEKWIPAFAGMTGVSKGIRCQMTPVPRHPLAFPRPGSDNQVVLPPRYNHCL